MTSPAVTDRRYSSIRTVGLGQVCGQRRDISGVELSAFDPHVRDDLSPPIFGVLRDFDSFQRVTRSAYAVDNAFGGGVPGCTIATAEVEDRAVGARSREWFRIGTEFAYQPIEEYLRWRNRPISISSPKRLSPRGSIGRGAVDAGDFTAHGTNVCAQLPAVMNGIE